MSSNREDGPDYGDTPLSGRNAPRGAERMGGPRGGSAANRSEPVRPSASAGGRERLSSDYDDEPPARRRAAQAATGGAMTSILGHDSATRKLVMGAAGIGAVLLLAVGGWSLMGGHHGGIPIIGPPPGPVKDRPTDPGGMQIMGGDGDDADVTGKGDAHLAPGPERPDATALARQYGVTPGTPASPDAPAGQPTAQTGASADKNASVPPAAQTVPNTASAGQPAPSAAVPGTMPSGQTTTASSPAPAQAPSSTPAPSDQAAATAPEVAPAEPKADQEPAQEEDASPQEKPAPARHAVTQKSAAPKALPAPVPETAAHAPVPEAPVSVAGNREVQLAALDSEAAAHTEWDKLRAQAPGLFAGHAPSFQKTVRGDHTFVRLRLGGFPDFKAARAFCVKLHAQSIACTPAQF